MRPSHAIIGTLALTCLLAACTTTRPGPTNGQSSSAASARAVTVHWSWLQTGTGSSGEPLNDVLLMQDGGGQLAAAKCTGVVSPVTLTGALAVRCWRAGGGDDFAVFQTGAALQVSTRTVDEQGGFGDWKVVKTIQ